VRVLILIKGLGRGGAEQLLLNAAPYLDQSRFSYRVAYLLPWKNALVPELEAEGISVDCLDGGRGVGWIRRLRGLVRDRRIDIIHSHSPYPATLARLAFLGAGKPFHVYTAHGVWERQKRLTYWGNLLTFVANDYVFAVSEHVRASIMYRTRLGFLPMPPVETLYHGLDLQAVSDWHSEDGVRAELGIPDGAPVIGHVANFRPLKGHHLLLEAAVRVRREFPEARFVLVGRGPNEDDVRRRTRELGLEEAVVFAGFREDVPRLVAAFDLFVLPSLHEGLSIALLEAMALGKPSVVSRVGGLPELIDHEREGLLIGLADSRAFAEGIIRLLRDANLRQRMGDAAMQKARLFDIRTAVRRAEEVYVELAGSGSRGRRPTRRVENEQFVQDEMPP
jgi:glycosyltransferase involved in cell wall biosynthesis